MLLVFDEIQVGCGRLGSLWAYQQYEVEPDIMTLAKPLAAACQSASRSCGRRWPTPIEAGDHAATFGGQPVACAAATAVLGKLLEPGFIDGVREKGEYLIGRLQKLQQRWPEHIAEVRGKG